MVKVNLAKMKNMADSYVKVCEKNISMLNDFNHSFENLINEQDLQGKAYHAAKQYIKNNVLILLTGLRRYSEDLANGAKNLPDLYVELCGHENLDSNELESQINLFEQSLAHVNELINRLENKKVKDSTIISLSKEQRSVLRKQLSMVKEKLEKLLEFDQQSAIMIGRIQEITKSLNDGLLDINSNIEKFRKNQNFALLNHSKAEWKNEINRYSWKKSKYPLNSEIEDLLQKIEKDRESKLISEKAYKKIKKDLLDKTVNIVKDALNEELTDRAVDVFCDETVIWLKYHFPKDFTHLTNGQLRSIMPIFGESVNKVAKYGAPVLGSAIEFIGQVNDGDDLVDAGIKTLTHSGLMVVGAAVGSVISVPFIAPAAVGLVTGVVLCHAFDKLYDYADEKNSNKRKYKNKKDNNKKKEKD